jgi:hypothetical protein
MSHRTEVLVAVAIIVGLVSIGLGSPAFAQGSTYYFPQVADGSADPVYYTSEFRFNNLQNTATTVTIKFFSNSGAPWVVDLRSIDRPDAGGNKSSRTFTLQPFETANFYTSATSPLAVGWAAVQASQPLVTSSGFTMFRSGSPPQLLWQAAVLPAPPSTLLACEANVSPHRDVFDGIGADTGFAIANPSDADATIMVTLLARWGNPPSGVRFINVPRGGHVSTFLSQLFEDLYFGDTFHGMVRFTSNVAVSMVALKRSHSSINEIYSTVPVQVEADLRRDVIFDREVNNSFAQAQILSVPAEIVGTVNYVDDTTDADFFKLDLLAGQTVYAFLVADAIDSPLDATLFLYDPFYGQLAASDTTHAGLKDPFVVHTVTIGGTFYLRVGSTDNSASRGQFYRLFVQVK